MQLAVTKLNEERIIKRIQNVLESEPTSLSVEGRTLQAVALILLYTRKPVPTFADDVDDFHGKLQLLPETITPDYIKFRNDRLDSELEEYHDAKTNEERLDALVDLVYVAIGTVRAMGWDFNEAWRRVHRANMLKEKAEKAERSKFGCKYDAIKPEGWRPPVMSDLVVEEVPE